MSLQPGVYIAYKKDSTKYYRSSFTYKNKHISLGSFDSEEIAHKAYLDASSIANNKEISQNDYNSLYYSLPFDKFISIANFRDNNMYFKNPIYLHKNYFLYYLDINTSLKFDVDDLFYYANHKIMKRGGHLFVSDYGMQVNIFSRYGIKNHSVINRDYIFLNGDTHDYRYANIKIINKYYGVTKYTSDSTCYYISKIHIIGDILIGRYSSEIEAAIAYNKAANLLNRNGFNKKFPQNYIVEINDIEYSRIYNNIRISKSIKNKIFE